MYFYYKKNSHKAEGKTQIEHNSLIGPMKNVTTDIVPYDRLHTLHSSDARIEFLEKEETIHKHQVSAHWLTANEKRFPAILRNTKAFPFSSFTEVKKSLINEREKISIAVVFADGETSKIEPELLRAISILETICASFKTKLELTLYCDNASNELPSYCQIEPSFTTVAMLFSHDYVMELECYSQDSSALNTLEFYLSQFGVSGLFSAAEQKILFDGNIINSVERHLLIVWEHALPALDLLKQEIEKVVTIVTEHAIEWPEDQFDDNMLRFYNQPKHIIDGKIKRVGRGDCLLLVVEDAQPEYDFRQTSRSVEYVNKTLFDLKNRLRRITVVDERIPQRWPDLVHSTNSTSEYRHDFMLLFGFSADNYDVKINNQDGYVIDHGLVGVDGWENFEQLFDCMNNCLEYVVMRNWDGLPDQATIQGHDDIDFLVDSLPSAMRILKAKKVFPRPYRVHCEIIVGGRPIRIDLRAVGDQYYPKEMQQRMLRNRVIENCFYVPNDEDHFYSLAYHAVIHKHSIGDDYVKKLQAMKPNEVITHKRLLELLAKYMLDNHWVYTRPEPSVKYNKKHMFLSSLTLDASVSNTSGFDLTDGCLIKKTPMRFLKFEVLEREIHWLEKMKGWQRVPQIVERDQQSLTFEYAGEPLKRSNMPKNYRHQVEEIIKGLKRFNCSHNDIWSENLLVDQGVIKLIDFQWASEIGEPIPKQWPNSIGDSSSFGRHNFVDEYSIWLSIKKILEGNDGRGK